ncbi:amidohydrolase family protein [Chloroflexota bacterium]
MKRIAIEEHVWIEDLKALRETRYDYTKMETAENADNKVERNATSLDRKSSTPPEMLTKLIDVEDIRLKDMDQHGIDMQVLSSTVNLAPYGSDGITAARQVNNAIAKLTKKYPQRFAGFATISPSDPIAAAMELERGVKELGLKGTMITSSISAGEYWDNQKYWIIFEKVEELGVPVYIHPTFVSPDMVKAFLPYSQMFGSVWGFAADTGLAAMRLICSGIFDKYPGLKIILGHLGEALPFWLWRIDSRWEKERVSQNPLAKKLGRKPGQYINENFYVTTSGMLYQPALQCTISALGVDKVMFAVDYPFEPSNEAVEFMDRLQINDTDKEKIYHLNAEELLKL